MFQRFQQLRRRAAWPLMAALVATAGCAAGSSGGVAADPAARPGVDPRVGLRAGRYDAGQVISNMRLLSATKSPPRFEDATNSDLAFTGNYAIQGNFNGWQVWDLTNPSKPDLVSEYYCPASQSDVSVYGNLLFVSGEGMGGRLDCGGQGVDDAISRDRLRGIRVFDISDIRNPRNVANVQTCRGSHTHSVLVDPKDRENVYIYISGSAGIRSEQELPGCSGGLPASNPNSALFRIEVIKVPLANPAAAAIVSSPRIFEGLVEAPVHGTSPADLAELEEARAAGAFVANILGDDMVLPAQFSQMLLDSIVKGRGGSGAPTGADSAQLRRDLPELINRMIGRPPEQGNGPRPGPNQCHDITLYPEIGLAGGACEGYGLLLDISNPTNPVRIDAVADSNFAYWHSATFNNSGTKVLFSDEWGGGGGPKCRAGDPMEWGANALFSIENRKMRFRSYYKMPAVQTSEENCVAHNGSLIPIPGRDVMIQAWYQGGLSLFDFTDIDNPQEIGFFDRGPIDANEMVMGGSWSVYWYNGLIVSSEIARGLDVLELAPSRWISQNEIDAAKTVKFDYLNAQGQPKFVWPASFSLARAYLDQLERDGGLDAARIRSVRAALGSAEGRSGQERRTQLNAVSSQLTAAMSGARDQAKVRSLIQTVSDLSSAAR